jgi:hypothetical protein
MTTAGRPQSPRGKWLIPVILGVIIVIVVLGATLGPRIKNALSSTPTATATPQKVVVTATPKPGAKRTNTGPTATPGGPTPTPQPGGVPPTATPSTSGASTPLPGSTPLPTVVGLHIGMVTRPASRVATIQHGADTNDPNYTFYLNPTTVVNKTLPAEGFTQGFTVVRPTTANPTPTPYNGPDGRPLVKYYVRYQGKIYTVQVVQPGTRGPRGIWVIATIFQGQQ